MAAARRSALAVLLWVLPLGASAYEVTAWLFARRGVPEQNDWKRAVDAVRSGRRPGDLVVPAPHWIRQTAYMHLGDDLVPLADAARADTTPYRRLWVVSIGRADAPESAGLRPEIDRRYGLVRVRRYPLGPPAEVAYDFLAHMEDARVEVLRGTERKACPWSDLGNRRVGRFVCDSRAGWNWVGERVMDDLRHAPRRGIWAHPVRGAKLSILYEDVPLAAVLYGYTGLGYEAARLTGHFPPVALDVYVDGTLAKRVLHHPRDVWKRFEIDTAARRGERADVSFVVSAKNPGMRHFYFVADARSPGARP